MKFSLFFSILGLLYLINLLWCHFTEGCASAFMFYHIMISIFMIFYGLKYYLSWDKAFPKLTNILSYFICILFLVAFLINRFR